MSKKLEILCVDDEPQVLEGLKLHLRQRYTVFVATSGTEGLEILGNNQGIGIILSDMRMPVMDGAKFLNAARSAAPNSVRMLLTGYTDMQAAIAAVNEGQIFRFISKPCPPDQLHAAFAAAASQHELIVSEKVLLQQTLLGCVESMAKVLSIVKPAAFGRALRLRSKVRAATEFLWLHNPWQIEAAAVLSQLGIVTLSEETLLKLNEGEPLDEPERRELAATIETSMRMIEDIPRLTPVIEILKALAFSMHSNTDDDSFPEAARLLRIVFEWDALEARGLSQSQALDELRSADGAFAPELLKRLSGMVPKAAAEQSARLAQASELSVGMVLAEDLVRKNGVVILPRGFEIDRALHEHILSFVDELKSPVRVYSHSP